MAPPPFRALLTYGHAIFPRMPLDGSTQPKLVVIGGGRIETKILSALEFDELSRSCRKLCDFDRELQLKTNVEANHEDFEEFLREAVEVLHPGIVEEDILAALVPEANRRLANLMASMRMFLDHTKTRIDRRYGGQSVEHAAFKKATAEQYDGHFEYRFVYKLRDYVQHCGMPVGEMIMRHDLAKTSMLASTATHTADGVRTSASLMFSRDSLLKDFDGWGIIRADLLARPPEIDARACLEATMVCFRRIFDFILGGAVEETRSAAEAILAVTRGLPGIEDERRIWIGFVHCDAPLEWPMKVSMKGQWLPEKLARRIALSPKRTLPQ